MGKLLTLQARVIGSLVLRETRASFGTSQFGYLWAIVTPAASVAVLVTIFTLIGRQPPFGQSLALFFATGILTLEFFNKLSNTLMASFDANKALLTYPLIQETDAIFARVILISATYLLVFVLFYGGLVLLGLSSMPTFPEVVIQAFAATALLGFGFGTVNAVIVSLWDSWLHIERVLTRPLFFLSGIFYIPSNLPPEAIAILEWNPVLHLVEWFREGFYPNYESTVLSKTYPLGLAVGLILFGLAGERLYRKKRV
ncbi:ABC transporter permease [Ruegeria profundi]|uniref:ABC transporter n=1 Tax=Ruegeria profundi TaxID=1685378 RepID=A0A0X3TNC8_9RHOB|nr:ABC transporter permease [Ruegeria profundi]KUJ77277.1 ABC transporter [Ruegeria profundi]